MVKTKQKKCMKEYLHFCRRENLAAILESKTIDRELSITKPLDYSNQKDIDYMGALKANFVYDTEKIQRSRCFLTYPFVFDEQGDEYILEVVEKKLLWFRWKSTIKTKIIKELHEKYACVVLLTDDIMLENYVRCTLRAHPQYDKILYCESYADKPIICSEVKEADLYIALGLIGITNEVQMMRYIQGYSKMNGGKYFEFGQLHEV